MARAIRKLISCSQILEAAFKDAERRFCHFPSFTSLKGCVSVREQVWVTHTRGIYRSEARNALGETPRRGRRPPAEAARSEPQSDRIGRRWRRARHRQAPARPPPSCWDGQIAAEGRGSETAERKRDPERSRIQGSSAFSRVHRGCCRGRERNQTKHNNIQEFGFFTQHYHGDGKSPHLRP